MSTNSIWITTAEVTEQFGIGRATLHHLRMNRDPRCPKTYRLGRSRYWDREGIEAMIRNALEADSKSLESRRASLPSQETISAKDSVRGRMSRSGRFPKAEEVARRREGIAKAAANA
jgi:predicted DNA-binding transcriptional regulator AlpA